MLDDRPIGQDSNQVDVNRSTTRVARNECRWPSFTYVLDRSALFPNVAHGEPFDFEHPAKLLEVVPDGEDVQVLVGTGLTTKQSVNAPAADPPVADASALERI